MREFNTASPCNQRQHYMINAADRIPKVDFLIDGGKYFVLHAARQSGKTTFIQDLALRLNAEGKYYYTRHEAVDGKRITIVGL
jgi:hypothetical protein